jgi:hypothetical protein
MEHKQLQNSIQVITHKTTQSAYNTKEVSEIPYILEIL